MYNFPWFSFFLFETSVLIDSYSILDADIDLINDKS